jgi:hypothetical protein
VFQTHQRLERDIREVFATGGGVMTLTLIGPTSAASIITAVMEGDVGARDVLSAADQLLRQIEQRSQARAMSCALCDNGVLWRGEAPHAIGTLRPFGVDHAPAAIGLAFCGTCAADRPERELGMAAVSKLRSDWMPDLRVLPPMSAAGRA